MFPFFQRKGKSIPLETISPIYPGHPDQCFGPTSYAQSGEDLIIANIFLLLRQERPTYLDIGANHPWHCSNTALLYKRGSRGVVIEASPEMAAVFHRERPQDSVLNVGAGAKPGLLPFYRFHEHSGRNTFSKQVADDFVREYPMHAVQDIIHVEVMTLDQIVEKFCDGKFPDYLSIDIEGLDQAVLEPADFSKTRPKVISSEMTEASPFLKSVGFTPYTRTWCNGIYLREDIAQQIAF